jgi:4-cresol dehydrogenase (hydroxylating)
MIGEIAQQLQEVSRRILGEHGFDYAVEFVCGPRAARALHIVIFNREDPDDVARMNAAYAALVEAYDTMGYPIGRTRSTGRSGPCAACRSCGTSRRPSSPRSTRRV